MTSINQTEAQKLEALNAKRRARYQDKRAAIKAAKKPKPKHPRGESPQNKHMRAKARSTVINKMAPLTPDQVLPAPGTTLPDEILTVQRAIDMTAELGLSLSNVCKKIKFSYARAYVLINAHPELVKRWNNARVYYLRLKVEEMEKISKTVKDVNRARLMCDNIKWEAQRVARHIYGDAIIVSGDANAPLVTKLVVSAEDIVHRIRNSKDVE